MRTYSGIHVLRWIFTFRSLVSLPFGVKQVLGTDWHIFDLSHWIALRFVAVRSTVLAYLLNVYGISIIGASSTGAYIYTQPVFAAVIAIIFAGEHFSIVKLIAAILIFTGVYLANSKKTVDA